MNVYPRLQRQLRLKPIFYRYAKGKLSVSQLTYNRSLTKASYPPRAAVDLKKGFDDENYWEESKAIFKNHYSSSEPQSLFSKFKNTSYDGSDGLFDNPYLDSPKGLKRFSKDSLKYAHDLVSKMKTDTSRDGLVKYVLRLDQLSDTLCRVIDLCELIRSVHPDDRFIEAAQSCHEEMFEFMNILNTDVDLCKTLAHVLKDHEISSRLSQEELKVGKILLEDFKKSGIYMNPEARTQFISLSQDISIVGQDFITNVDAVKDLYINVPVKDLDQDEVGPAVMNQLSKDISGSYYKIPSYGSIPFILLRTCRNEDIRSKIWASLHSSSKEQINRLTQLVKLRAILARIMGKESYAAYQLGGKMAKEPHDVKMFLESLMKFSKSATAKELKPIADMKCKSLGKPIPQSDEEIFHSVRPWDRDYYSFQIQSQNKQNKQIQSVSLSTYFTIGSVIQGLSDIFKTIYGISFELSPTKPKEIWAPDVRKIIVTSEKDGPIGVIYCDLFERQGKPSSPAHFTVCCSREMYPKENNESIMQIGMDNNGVKFQLPIISLVCSFSRSSEGACLLQLNEIETLFHEMGHAMHSMLGRTKLQNISGTRCATDFVELPSILMEHFAKDERVLLNIGRHYISGEQVPKSLVRDQIRESSFLQNCENFAQAKMSMLDQRLHDETIVETIDTLDVVKIYQDLEKELDVLVDNRTNWCGKFGHLFGYGATYYSYLFDRAIAAKIWNHLFAKNPYSRANGNIFKDSVLKWGGLKDPWSCVADVLDNPELKKGDTNAIKCIAEVEDL